ncbi:MAG: F0F1 ATP synthase subunit delta [Alphaproteobacteria bacterium]|nr:F0F1 ATP synthase subunit delta [Alphaproteobacteria bacterium]
MATDDSAVSGLAGRYATALFELAHEAKALDRVGEDLATIRRLLDESVDLNRLVLSPVVSRTDQGRAMAAIMAVLGAHPLTVQTIGLMAAKRRLFALADVIRGYRGLVAAHRGESSAEVTSARPLKPEEQAELAAALKRALGRDVAIAARVDPTLLGGLVVKVGSRMIDSSLRAKLARLQLAMKGVA